MLQVPKYLQKVDPVPTPPDIKGNVCNGINWSMNNGSVLKVLGKLEKVRVGATRKY